MSTTTTQGRSFRANARANNVSGGAWVGPNPSAIATVTIPVTALTITEALQGAQTRLDENWPLPAGAQIQSFNEVYSITRQPAAGGDPDVTIVSPSPVTLAYDVSLANGAVISPSSTSSITAPEGTQITFVLLDLGGNTSVELKDKDDNYSYASFTAVGDYAFINMKRDDPTVNVMTIMVVGHA